MASFFISATGNLSIRCLEINKQSTLYVDPRKVIKKKQSSREAKQKQRKKISVSDKEIRIVPR